ncbi:hypothetical protein BCY84_04829 [Trypanosoma cruzi cruzi]|nr:hypothetical protein BCY84_04829 [Trypanosoma cruzi cruzi]
MMKSLRRDAAGRGRQRKDRSAFWVAPPQRYVINRHSPKAVPHSLSVVVVVDPHMVEPTAFLQPIAPLANDKRKCGAAGNRDAISAEPDSASDQVVPSFFRLDIYVWDDTTLREILEEVLASSAAARQVLLPSDAPATATAEVVGKASRPPASTGAERAEKRGGRDGGGDDGGNGNLKDDDDDGASVELDDGDDSVGGDAADEEPASKRERTEGEKKQRDETRMGAPSAAKRAQPRDRRPPPTPAANVRLFHVFVDSDKKPQVRDIALLRVDRPVFHAGDYTTMQEMRAFQNGRARMEEWGSFGAIAHHTTLQGHTDVSY